MQIILLNIWYCLKQWRRHVQFDSDQIDNKFMQYALVQISQNEKDPNLGVGDNKEIAI